MLADRFYFWGKLRHNRGVKLLHSEVGSDEKNREEIRAKLYRQRLIPILIQE